MASMTSLVNVEKSLAVMKIAIAKAKEIVAPWVKVRYAEAKPVVLKFYEKTKSQLEGAFTSEHQKAN